MTEHEIRQFLGRLQRWQDIEPVIAKIFYEMTKNREFSLVAAQIAGLGADLGLLADKALRKNQSVGGVISKDEIKEMLELLDNIADDIKLLRLKEEHISESGLGVGGAPRKGKPKTEKERKKEHIRRYGIEELPPRGTGLKK